MKKSKKIRKNTQLSLIKSKRAGRPATTDIGIRHISRERVNKPTAFHLTIKVRENKADIKNKRILKALHHAIKRARLKKLRIIHYTLEYNHIHLLVETDHHRILHCGMQALGISLSKAINKMKQLKGTVYKHRYHLRKLTSRRQCKNVIHYILKNGMKHKGSRSILNLYNSFLSEKKIPADIEKIITEGRFLMSFRKQLRELLDGRSVYFISPAYLWSS